MIRYSHRATIMLNVENVPHLWNISSLRGCYDTVVGMGGDGVTPMRGLLLFV